MLHRLILTPCLLLTLALLLAAPAARAVQPDEMLSDPALESRARAISQQLRCPVCQGEDIDDSGAAVAHDLRLLVRARLLAGDTDRQVIDYVVARYGEYVLFNPRRSGANLILWYAGPGMLIVALGGVVWWLRRRAALPEPDAPLTGDEEARLRALLKR